MANGAEAAHNNPQTSPLMGGGLFGGGGGLETALLISTLLGSVGNTVNSLRGRGRGRGRSGGGISDLLLPLLLSQQMGLFNTNSPRTTVAGQETPTGAGEIQTVPAQGSVAPIGPSGGGMNTGFGLQGPQIPGLGPGGALSGAGGPQNILGSLLGGGGPTSPLFSLR